MADSNITKRALAASMKELMAEKSLEKISVTDICGRCGMHRKSFYYHFKDKYDLVNWIYDTEFLIPTQEKYHNSNDIWMYLQDACYYLYENRTFYRRALRYTGQNSLGEHFRDQLRTAVKARIERSDIQAEWNEFQVNFLADGITFTIQQWIMKKECMQPDEFLNDMKTCVYSVAERVCAVLEKATAE